MSESEENNKMTSQAQALALEEMDQPSSVEVRFDPPASADHGPIDNPNDNPIDEEQQYRASAYALIAALLRSAPDQEMLDRLDGLSQETTADGDDLLLAMSTLALSAKIHTPMAIDDEFHNLFIGLGKGEVCLLYTSDAADEEDSVQSGAVRHIVKNSCSQTSST